MAKANKTQQTELSVESYYAAISDPARRADCEALAALMQKVTGEPAKMWGIGIVGFGSVHYKYESGREGDTCLLGFASRKEAMVLYIGLGAGLDAHAMNLAKLGKHKTGKGCLYIQRMQDVDTKVLMALLKTSVAAKRS